MRIKPWVGRRLLFPVSYHATPHDGDNPDSHSQSRFSNLVPDPSVLHSLTQSVITGFTLVLFNNTADSGAAMPLFLKKDTRKYLSPWTDVHLSLPLQQLQHILVTVYIFSRNLKFLDTSSTEYPSFFKTSISLVDIFMSKGKKEVETDKLIGAVSAVLALIQTAGQIIHLL